jgi:hypothetical protein
MSSKSSICDYRKPISISSTICSGLLIWLPLIEYIMIIDTSCVLNNTDEHNNLVYTLGMVDIISYAYVITFSINTYITLTIILSRDIIYRCSTWSINYKIFVFASIIMIIYWVFSMVYSIYMLNLSNDIRLSINLKNITHCIVSQSNLIDFYFDSLVTLIVVLFVSTIGLI